MRYTTLVLAMLTVVACQDPVRPPEPQAPQPRKISLADTTVIHYDARGRPTIYVNGKFLDGPNLLESEGGSGSIPTYVQNANAQRCLDGLNIANHRITASRIQTLSWVEQHVPRQETVAGQFTQYFRYYEAYEGSIPIRCVRLDSLKVLRTAWEFFGFVSQPWFWYTSPFSYCYGITMCGNQPPYIEVATGMQFSRECAIDEPGPRHGFQFFQLGGTSTNYGDSRWSVRLYTNGNWVVFDYGGFGNQQFGYPSQQFLCGRYFNSYSGNGYWEQREGYAQWAVSG